MTTLSFIFFFIHDTLSKKIFGKIKKKFLPTNPIVKSEVTWNTHIFFFGQIKVLQIKHVMLGVEEKHYMYVLALL
jgi:hypothetical protein